MDRIDANDIDEVIDVMHRERREFVTLLRSLDEEQWLLSTECPAYTVQGVASHVLGDDLSLLSRQRDGAVPGLLYVAEKMPGADFRGLLNGFNDQWVEATRFMSAGVLVDLLVHSGEWTENFYRSVDPLAACEPVPLFGPEPGGSSVYWQAIVREYLERWTHHSQIRRALGQGSLDAPEYIALGLRILSSALGALPVTAPHSDDGTWEIGPLSLGVTSQAGDILTIRYTADEVAALVAGPDESIAEFAAITGRRLE